MNFEKNQIVRIDITDIGENGEGIGKADGYTLFCKDAVSGDTVEAIITKAKKNYGYAKVKSIIKSSEDRVTPVCENANRCGGCQIQNISYESQLKYKEDKVKNSLIRIGGFDKEHIEKIMEPIVGADDENIYRYRNKAQFPIGCTKDGEIVSGFYAGRTHSIIPRRDCSIGIKENEEVLNAVIDYMNKNHISAYDENTGKGVVRHVLIRKGFTSGQIMVCLVVKNINALKKQDELINELKKINGMTSICVSVNSKNTNVIMGEEIHYLWGEKVITDSVFLRNVENDFTRMENLKVDFEISPLSFYQVNPNQMEKLYSIAIDFAELKGDEEVWDLCCGIGTISLCVAKYMDGIFKGKGKVHGIEIVPEAIEDAKRNAQKNNIANTHFVCGAAEEYLPAHRDEISADVIIMDPPRKGMEEEALEVVAKAKPKKIVYVSCDPASLARDLKYLCDRGYCLEKVRPVDMFPHTVHVETVVSLGDASFANRSVPPARVVMPKGHSC